VKGAAVVDITTITIMITITITTTIAVTVDVVKWQEQLMQHVHGHGFDFQRRATRRIGVIYGQTKIGAAVVDVVDIDVNVDVNVVVVVVVAVEEAVTDSHASSSSTSNREIDEGHRCTTPLLPSYGFDFQSVQSTHLVGAAAVLSKVVFI